MLPDPVTIAAASPTPSLVFATVRSDGYGSERVDTGGNGYTVIINHTKGKTGNRHYVKMTQTKNATDPYSGLTKSVSSSCSISIARSPFGFTDADIIALAKALTDFRDDSEVTTAKLLTFQS
ncbi:TPA_asm: coat protein [ssRNA phage Zoerhiza.1_25]|uniref:Coat protein n=2 Tax=Leviviricetes TaxID=2842243 RepID=A0A8S5L2X1_9VIRU|nr:coat protein [ssRNA phage Zoerhiza.1_25]QDH89615.1 MAG: hypothetical protein H1Rhizo26FD342_000003 [Leviviridae sp.]DAD51498.1 TPA_asm: coat protein [ssRNA phage Zoerhiza.1_25]